MADDSTSASADQTVEIDLRDPIVAGLLAWLWPGAGHLYQRRYAKGVLFMVCILGTYLFGLVMSGYHAVYASWKPSDRRWQYICQLGVGGPSLPALVQTMRLRSGKPPFMTTAIYQSSGSYVMEEISLDELDQVGEFGQIYFDAPMAPPGEVIEGKRDLLAIWNERYHAFLEMGALFTVVAGLLNVLVIYDAIAGPMAAMPPLEKSEQYKQSTAPDEPTPESTADKPEDATSASNEPDSTSKKEGETS